MASRSIAGFVRNCLNSIQAATVKDVTDITDRVFLLIESNEDLLKEYRQLHPSQKHVNRMIGKLVREQLCLTNLGREGHPQSGLIKSYEKHGLK